MPETIFAKIIRKEIPATVVYEDDDVLAFNDIAPQAPVHILVIPKRTDLPTTNDLASEHDALSGKLLRVAAQIARELGIADNGYRLVVNCNSDGGQAVDHIHVHLLGGRMMNWPPG